MKKGLALFAVLIVTSLALNGVAYSVWKDDVHIFGVITTTSEGGGGSGACVEIQKTLYGSYTDPYTGKSWPNTTNLIRIGSNSGLKGISCPPPLNFPTYFKLCINVTNCGPTDLTNVTVTDRLENQFAKVNYTKSDSTDWVKFLKVPVGGSGFYHTYLTWKLGTLAPGEWATLCIWIKTVQNPAGFYEPTSPGSYLVNIGANVEAVSVKGNLTAQTEGIVLEIGDFVAPNIAEILTTLPYSTPWANDHIDP